jgi:hypothetical protein
MYINDRQEAIIHPRENVYFRLKDCETEEDVIKKILHWLSRPASKSESIALRRYLKISGFCYLLYDTKHELTKPYELLYNYNRYRELVDTVELDWEDKKQPKWYNHYDNTLKVWIQNYNIWSEEEGARYFSTEAHAQAFLKLAQENDCL